MRIERVEHGSLGRCRASNPSVPCVTPPPIWTRWWRRRTTSCPTPRSMSCSPARRTTSPTSTCRAAASDRYSHAAKLYRSWRDADVLVLDDQPSFTIYRLRFTDATGTARDISGVLGGLEVVDEGAGGVLPHERTTPKASTDRLDLTRATAANLSPVWGLSLATWAHRRRCASRARGSPASSTAASSTCVERVVDPDRIERIRQIVGERRRPDRRRTPPVRRSAGPIATRCGRRPASRARRPN